MSKQIGIIGVGIMGEPMAKNLIDAGFEVTAYDVNREAVDRVAAYGGNPASSPKEAAASKDLVVTMLPDDRIVLEAVMGKNGAMEGMSRGTILVDMSTVSPATSKKIAETLESKGMEMLDAPVSGGDVGAKEASLAIMVGGKKKVFDKALPVLQKMGKNVSYVGDHGAGEVAKAANQIIVALTIEAVAEALIFTKKSGVDPEKVRNALLGGFAQSRILELHGQRMLDRNFEPGGKVRLHKKDTEIAMTSARELGMYLPGTALVSHLWNAIAAQDGLDWDHSAIVKVLETLSNTEVCPD
ncbi:MAG: 2-hydroxy-3-oxopropionate reductase [Deltaproteobacteria bacterium]|jgi:2-hydroxy-3-oxopropionate reductase|nr:2-hydroxy-3-oxopropionate reductase [Deltaproteobacteria bacterium]